MSSVSLFLDQLKKNPRAKVIITLGGFSTVVGYIAQNLSITGSANWSAPSNELIDSINAVANEATTLLNRFTGVDKKGGIPTIQMVDAISTAQVYGGSDPFSFAVNLVFVSARATDNVTYYVKTLIGATQPTGELTGGLPTKITPPLGYVRGKSFAAVAGVVGVSIGGWFATGPRMLVRSASFEFSKQVTPLGRPLFAAGQVEFISYRMLSAAEISGMFR